MKTPVNITCDRNLLQAVGKVWLIVFGAWIAIVAITPAVEGHASALLKQEFWLKVSARSLPMPLMLLLPLSFSPFIRPRSRSRKDMFIQGGLILLFAGLIFTTIEYYFLNGAADPYEIENKVNTTAISTGIFIFLNVIIYLPIILMTKDAKS